MKKDLSVMIKPASSLCNMRCKYCFYHSLANTRESFGYGIMSNDTSENIVKKTLEFCEGGSIYFAFQGGEPLYAGKEFFENFVKLIKKYNTLDSKIFFSLQTNGTLIDDEWAEFFAKHNFLLGVSLDGDQDANRFRVDTNLDYTFLKVRNALGLLKKHNVDFNILVVATGYTAKNIEKIYSYFKSQDFNYLQFIPCLRPFGDKSESMLYMTEEEYGDYLIRLFNLYVKDYVRGEYTSIRHFDNMVRLFLGQKAEQCGMEGHCTYQFVIEANGNVYPCDFYCIDEWLLGNINSKDMLDMANSKKAQEFIKESLIYPEKCKSCEFFKMCRAGGCKRARADRDYCSAYKKFFKSCLPLFRVFLNEKGR